MIHLSRRVRSKSKPKSTHPQPIQYLGKCVYPQNQVPDHREKAENIKLWCHSSCKHTTLNMKPSLDTSRSKHRKGDPPHRDNGWNWWVQCVEAHSHVSRSSGRKSNRIRGQALFQGKMCKCGRNGYRSWCTVFGQKMKLSEDQENLCGKEEQ